MSDLTAHSKILSREFLILLLILTIFSTVTYGATIEVTALINEPGCDLIEAIQSANGDTPVGGCTAGNGADDIQLLGTHTLSEPFNNPGDPISAGDAGLPNITSDINIIGISGQVEIRRQVIDPTTRFRIFNITGGNTLLTLNNIIVSGGDINFPDSGDDTINRGGGIYISSGELILNDSSIVDNIGGSFGGGLYSSTAKKITINHSRIANNIANHDAAFNLANVDEEILITDSTIEGNETRSGVSNICSSFNSNSIKFIRSAIINNNGTGLSLYRGSLTMLDSTVSGNGLVSNGNFFEDEAGISISPGEESILTIINSTITDNPRSDYEVTDSVTFSGIRLFPPNSTTTDSLSVILRNNIISGNGVAGINRPQTGFEINVYDDGANFDADNISFEFSKNIIGHAEVSQSAALNNVSISGTTNQILVSDAGSPTALREILNPLGSYGGPTKSHTLPPDSPAIDDAFTGFASGNGINAVWNPGCRGEVITPGGIPPYRNDQRDLSRPIGNACDVGSTEFRPSDILSDCYVIKASNDNVITFCL